MSYQVNRFNGTLITTVADGTIDSSTDLRLIGKNYAGYGEVQNENFLHLLENFANTTAPPKKLSGQIWYDTANKKLKFYDGSIFRVAGGAEVSSTAPSGLTVGDFWWDTSSSQLYSWAGHAYVLVGPVIAPDLGASAVIAQVVKDTLDLNHTILKIVAGSKVIEIISADAFTLKSEVNPIPDFTVIKKGVTLAKTNAIGVSSDNYVYWGTASNADRLGGILADQYLQKGNASFASEIKFFDPGFTVGDSNDLRVRIENGNEVIVENRLGNPITFRITVTEISDVRDVAIMNSTGVVPGKSSEYNLGSATLPWKNIYATTTITDVIGSITSPINETGHTTAIHTGTFKGNVIASDGAVMVNFASKQLFGQLGTIVAPATVYGSLEGNVTGTASNASALNRFSPSLDLPAIVDKTSVPVRDALGAITASRFIGIADKADKLLVGATYLSSSLLSVANTVAIRDASGDLYAALFQGTATAARYADLAEKYLTDNNYQSGTVVVVGGDAEVTACSMGQRPIGVVSTNPAYMMNSELEGGTYIALKGRVPVLVVGPIKKGDQLIAANNGYAMLNDQNIYHGFAIALESNDDEGIKLIEAVVL